MFQKQILKAMTVSQQENIFTKIIWISRMSGETDAYGNKLALEEMIVQWLTIKNSIKSVQPRVSSQMDAVKPGLTPDGPTNVEMTDYADKALDK